MVMRLLQPPAPDPTMLNVEGLERQTHGMLEQWMLELAVDEKKQKQLLDVYTQVIKENGLPPENPQNMTDAIQVKYDAGPIEWSTIKYYLGKFRVVRRREVRLGNCINCFKPLPIGMRCYECSPREIAEGYPSRAGVLMMQWTCLPLETLCNQGRDIIDPLIAGCEVLSHEPYISVMASDHEEEFPDRYKQIMLADLPFFMHKMHAHGTLEPKIPILIQYISEKLDVGWEEVLKAAKHLDQTEGVLDLQQLDQIHDNLGYAESPGLGGLPWTDEIDRGVEPIQPPQDPELWY